MAPMTSETPVAVNLSAVQALRKAVLLLAAIAGIAFLVIGGSRWPSGTFIHEALEWIGLGLILFCIVGRTYCTLYIGGRKVQTLVDRGPYSISRNPLYLFSIVGAAGVGAQLGSIVLAIAAAVIVWFVFLLVIYKEEAALAAHFGEAYRDYRASVPRLWPDFRLWRDLETVEVSPRLVRVTLLDASFFLVSLPLAEGFEYLHDIGLLPTLIALP
jgi:protein-S-isoprenylcysteine O-methyltransferase Ste14